MAIDQVSNVDGLLFDVPYPLGQIIYEENNLDENLIYLNTIPEYIEFVNEV